VVIEVQVSQEEVTVVITGELDLTTQAMLAERLSLALGARPRRLVLDMAGTGFVDCASAREIASVRQFLPDGRRLIIRHPSRAVRRVFELTGFDRCCEIEDELRSDHACHAAGCTPRPDRAWPTALRGDASR
jgi:anti-anti-sigma factor